MGKPMKMWKKLKNFFTEKGYGATKDESGSVGVIVSEEDYKKMQDYLDWAEEQIKEVYENIEEVDEQYRSQIEGVNSRIREINKQIRRILNSKQKDIDIDALIQEAIQQLEEKVQLEVGEFKRNKNKEGQEFGGLHATVSDPSIGKSRGGIIKATNDKNDYTGEYIQIKKAIEILEELAGKINEMPQGKKADISEIDEIVAGKMAESGKQAIKKNKGLNGVRVTQKTFLRKRTAAILLALGVTATAAVGLLRGTNVNISGAHGNEGVTTGVEEQIKDAKKEYENAYRQAGIDYQEQLAEQFTLGEFSGDPALDAEEKRIDYQVIGDGFAQKENSIINSYGDVSLLSQQDSADYYLAQYDLLLDQYDQTVQTYNEDSTFVLGIKDANQKHMDISDGIKEPQPGQEGLVGSLDAKDMLRHQSQNQLAEENHKDNEEAKNEIKEKIDDVNQRREFISSMKQMEGFEEITQGNFENVFESLYQMYNGHSDEISIEDFIKVINDNRYNLNVLAEYAKEELDELSFEESLARFGLIDNSYKVYLEEYGLYENKVDISSYTQFANQYIADNPEIGKEGGFFDTIKGEFSQNDMNSGFYSQRQDGGEKEGVIKSIFRNIKTIFNGQRRGAYKEAVDAQKKAIETANKATAQQSNSKENNIRG